MTCSLNTDENENDNDILVYVSFEQERSGFSLLPLNNGDVQLDISVYRKDDGFLLESHILSGTIEEKGEALLGHLNKAKF